MDGLFPPIANDFKPEDPSRIVGVIVMGVEDERLLAMHAQAGYPVVSVDHWSINAKVDVVVVDCFREGQVAAEFLLSQGHRRLFFIGPLRGHGQDRGNEPDAELLLAGMQRILQKHGLALPPERIRFIPNRNDSAQETLEWIVSLRPRPTAGIIFAASILQWFVKHLPDLGLACPKDLSLLCKGFHGDPVRSASLRCNAEEMGETAVNLLLDRASGKRQNSVVHAIRSNLERGPTVRVLDND